MKLNYSILLLSLISLNAFSQTWQWGKRGGGGSQIEEGSGEREQTYSIVTDAQKNIYTLSVVGGNTINIDGQTYAGLDFGAQIGDIALSSFSCDGTHRWSKIIGSSGYDRFQPLQIDASGNIYLSGHFGSASGPSFPQKIGLDHSFGTNPTDQSRIIVMKFSGEGTLLWFQKVQPQTISASDAIPSGVKGFAIEEDGTSHILAILTPGTYANGAFTATIAGNNFYILKYGPSGNFIGSTYLDMQFLGNAASRMKFYRNRYNGNYYFVGDKAPGSDATVSGQSILNSAYLFSFSGAGQFLWRRENNVQNITTYFYNLDFDSESNIYIAGRFIGLGIDSFLGFSLSEPTTPSFLMKTNPTAQGHIWATANNGTFDNRSGSMLLNGGTLAVASAGYGTAFTWGGVTANINANGTLTDILLSRFNASTGACLSMNTIASSSGSDDRGTAIAVDVSGDYIVGGAFASTLNINGTSSLTNIGGQSDFMVAKFATSPCSPLSTEEFNFLKSKVYPNPSSNQVIVRTFEDSSYCLRNISGQMIKKGSLLSGDNTVDIQGVPSGLYILTIENSRAESFKLVIR